MKPERAIERAAHRRAAMYVAELGWLDGFPLDEHSWHVLGAKINPIAIDGARIAKSRRAARSALREHRDGLAAIVGDVERWWSIVDAKLAWCSSPTRPLDLIDQMPSRAARSARALSPQLQPAIVAASITWATRPAELARVIAWLAAHPSVMTFGVVRAIELAAMGLLDDGAGAVLALLEIDAPDPVVAVQRLSAAEALIQAAGQKGSRRKPHALEPVATTTPAVLEWFDRLVGREPEIKRRSAQLVAAADLAGALAAWRHWIDDNGARIQRAFEFVSRRLDATDLRHVAGVAMSLAKVRAAVPAVAIVVREALLDLDFVARDDRFHAAAARFIARVPASTPIARARMLQHCARTALHADDPRAAWVWDAIVDELDRGGSETIFELWSDVIKRGRWNYFDGSLFDHPSRARARRWAAIVTHLPGQVTRWDTDRVAGWLAMPLADDVVRGTVIGQRRFSGYLWPALAPAAIALSDGTATDLAHVSSQFMAMGEDSAVAVARVIEHAASAGAGWLVRELLASGGTDPLVEAARVAALVPRGQWPPIASTMPSPWIARYPEALAPALHQLAMVRPDADKVARRRLAPDIADPEALATEIAALVSRQPLAPGLAKRLANLEARLRAPRLPSALRLARLAAGVTRLAATTGLERFVADVTTAATARMARVFGLGRWPGWTLDRRTTEIFVGLLDLPERDRALAGRLLRARMGPRPWDLRDEPANRVFVDRLRASGVVMEPWLDDSSVTRRGGDGLPVELALESDPLEVFAMGAHFRTCLSPGDINFFSVVANAADVNKRVLYARREGAVVGRCLLAITDAGALLAFHPYWHARALGFDQLVATFVTELAARMNTVVAPNGKVSVVVASRWYDDGSRDLAGQFAPLYRVDTAAIELSAYIAAVRTALGRELDELTLPYVVASPGVLQRPELVLLLAPYLLRHAVEPRTMVAAAELAFRAGDREMADRLLGDRVDAVDLSYPGGELLAELRPSQTLAMLRASRRRDERSWRDASHDRQMLAAIALGGLHRPGQAAALYRRILEFRTPFAGDVRRRLQAISTERSEPSTIASRRASRSRRR